MFCFRKFDEEMPFDSQSVTIFRLRDRVQVKSKNDKQKLAQSHQEGDEYFAAWTGQWSTDIFEFPKEALVSLLLKSRK